MCKHHTGATQTVPTLLVSLSSQMGQKGLSCLRKDNYFPLATWKSLHQVLALGSPHMNSPAPVSTDTQGCDPRCQPQYLGLLCTARRYTHRWTPWMQRRRKPPRSISPQRATQSKPSEYLALRSPTFMSWWPHHLSLESTAQDSAEK